MIRNCHYDVLFFTKPTIEVQYNLIFSKERTISKTYYINYKNIKGLVKSLVLPNDFILVGDPPLIHGQGLLLTFYSRAT